MLRHAYGPVAFDGGGTACLVTTAVSEHPAGEDDNVVVADGQIGIPAAVGEQPSASDAAQVSATSSSVWKVGTSSLKAGRLTW